jgi:hypothetical protein
VLIGCPRRDGTPAASIELVPTPLQLRIGPVWVHRKPLRPDRSLRPAGSGRLLFEPAPAGSHGMTNPPPECLASSVALLSRDNSAKPSNVTSCRF